MVFLILSIHQGLLDYPYTTFYKPKQNRDLTATLGPCLFGATELLEVLESKTTTFFRSYLFYFAISKKHSALKLFFEKNKGLMLSVLRFFYIYF